MRRHTEELIYGQMVCHDLVDSCDSHRLYPAQITAGKHFELVELTILGASRDEVLHCDSPARFLERLRGMTLKVLLGGDSDSELEVIHILTDFDWFLEESFLDVVADNGDLGPLRVVMTHLEDGEDSDGAKNGESAECTTAGVE